MRLRKVWTVDPTPQQDVLIRCIDLNPGIHLRELGRQTGLGLTTASEALSALERGELVVSRTDGRYKRYFLPGVLGEREEGLVIAYRSPRAREVIQHLLDHSPASQRELADAANVTRSAIAPTVRSLVDRGILTCTRARRQNAYSLADAAYAAEVLARHGEIQSSVVRPTLGMATQEEAPPLSKTE